jgi:ATP-dependent phosphofructokinase / diphosphate-dependent phosphofructokinase
MRLGVLTGGGDCPGLNAVLRAIVRAGARRDVSFVGFRDGWRGVLDDDPAELDLRTTRGILHRGGTILGSSGTDPMRRDDGPAAVEEAVGRHGLDGLIAIGGEGTLGAAAALSATSRSGSIPRSRLPPTRSTGSTRRRNRTTASW